MAEEFSGFANAPVDEDGKRLDFREVANYEDKTDAGKVRDESQKAESSVVQFRTEGPSTNGAPAAVVAGSQTEETSEEVETPDADAAEGKGANDA